MDRPILFRVRDSILQIFCAFKWRSVQYVAWNNVARRGDLRGLTLQRVCEVLWANKVVERGTVPEFEFKE